MNENLNLQECFCLKIGIFFKIGKKAIGNGAEFWPLRTAETIPGVADARTVRLRQQWCVGVQLHGHKYKVWVLLFLVVTSGAF